MPFLRVDPWREQYFKKYDCPDNVQIPTKDNDAFQFNPVQQIFLKPNNFNLKQHKVNLRLFGIQVTGF